VKKWAAVCVLVGTLVFFGFGSDGCDDETPQSDKAMNAGQEQLSNEAMRQVGMPGITNFTEKKIVRKLYELRDQNIATHAYVMDMNGRLFHVCESIGYGLPYGVEFSNPDRPLEGRTTGEFIAMPQAEPNGLFMPPTAEGTWVICADQNHKGQIAPVYVEPRVIVSPFPLHAAGEWQESH
jgi:hypothetical protein